MHDTSRRIPKEELLLLDELQYKLKRKGLKISQKQLLAKSIKFVIEHQNNFIQELDRKKDNTKEMTERFLKHAKKYDFGPNWMEEIDTSI